MQKSSIIKGEWYIPGNPENKLFGTLFLSHYDRITLELVGSFDEPIDQIKLLPKNTIQGITTKGEKITLCNCLVFSINSALSKLPETKYLIHLVALGEHYNNEGSIYGKKVRTRIDLLEKWVNIYNYDIDTSIDGKLELKSKTLEEKSFQIDSETTGRFFFTNTYNLVRSPVFTYNQITYFEIESSNDKTNIQNFITQLFKFKKLVTIGITEEVSLVDVTIIKDDGRDSKPVEIFFNQNKPIDNLDRLSHHDFFFTFTDLESRFDEIANNWFKNESLEPIINYLFIFFQNRKSYAEDTFLDSIRGLEVFHRRLRQNTIELKESFDIKIDRICSNLETDDSKLIREKLEYAYEPSLRIRLKDLISEMDEEIVNVFFKGKTSVKKFINKVTIARNYYTHFSENLKKSAVKGADLIYLSKKTNLFLEILLLIEIGLSIDTIKNLLDRYYYKISYFMEK